MSPPTSYPWTLIRGILLLHTLDVLIFTIVILILMVNMPSALSFPCSICTSLQCPSLIPWGTHTVLKETLYCHIPINEWDSTLHAFKRKRMNIY